MQGNTRGVPIDTDVTLSADSDGLVASQKATRTYFDSSNAIRKLATVTGINGLATGQTTLYTVPAGKELVVMDVVIRAITVTNYTVDMAYQVGITPNFDEIVSEGEALSTTILSNQHYSTGKAGNMRFICQTFTAGSVIKFDVITGATADVLDLAIDLFGYLLDA